MESLAAVFAGSFVIAFSGALMPGPLLTATISESGRRGWRVGPLYILGHAVLEIALAAGLLAGLAPYLTGDVTFIIIAFAGGGVLVWMALGMFRSLPKLSLADPAAVNSAPGRRGDGSGLPLPLTGALMSLANPYWTIWWATIGQGYLLSSREAGPAGPAAFLIGHLAADLIWYALVAAGAAKGSRILPTRAYRALIGICAAFLVAYAGFLVVRGILRMEAL